MEMTGEWHGDDEARLVSGRMSWRRDGIVSACYTMSDSEDTTPE